MTNPTGSAERSGIPWMVAGTSLLAMLVLLVWRFGQGPSPTELLARKASRVDLVGRMQTALASASEAEKSAVLAVTDADSQAFADQARAATAEVEQGRQALASQLPAGGTAAQRDLLARFSDAFKALQRVDEEVLQLAVKNTNLKASALSFGPAMEAVEAVDAALHRLAARRAATPDASQVLRLASGARIGVLRIQVLLAPHIAEERDAEMDRLEASMAGEAAEVRKDLEALAASPPLAHDTDLETAAAAFARYLEVEARILALSRENTNVRSLSLSLNQKRKALSICLEALEALRQAVLDEPIAGVTYGKPAHPR